MNINKNTAEINTQAFLCEMRCFPSCDFTNIEKKNENFDTLSPKEKAEVGLAYFKGIKLPKDKEKAVEIWTKNQCAESLLYLSVYDFIKKNNEKAFQDLHSSANLGNKEALLRLGYCYIMGIGVTIDINKAYKIFENLAHQRVPEAVYFVGATQMLPGQSLIEYDVEKAQQKLLWSVEHGCKFAEFEHGVVLLGKAKNKEEQSRAIEYITRAAQKNEVRAMLWLAVEYSVGNLVEKDLKKSEYYMQQCIKLEFPPAVEAFKVALKHI